MTEEGEKRIIGLMENIVANQQIWLSRQAEALELQKSQMLKAEQITSRAEKLQTTSIRFVRWLFGFLLIVVAAWVMSLMF